MAVDDSNVIDGIAYDGEILILEVYDHLGFEGKFEFEHITILQDKLNTYLWYIDSKQYLCKKYIDVSNEKLQSLKVTIIPVVDHENL